MSDETSAPPTWNAVLDLPPLVACARCGEVPRLVVMRSWGQRSGMFALDGCAEAVGGYARWVARVPEDIEGRRAQYKFCMADVVARWNKTQEASPCGA